MQLNLAATLAVCVCLLSVTACVPAATPPPVPAQTLTPISPPPRSASPSPTSVHPCATAVAGSAGSTSTTVNSPVFATPLTELPTLSPAEIATREAGMQHANPGAPTTAADLASTLPPCSTPTPSAVNRATLPPAQAVPATPTGG